MVGALIVVSSCNTMPHPSEPVNAFLDETRPLEMPKITQGYDAVVMVSVTTVSVLGERQKGQWIGVSHVCKAKVLAVLDGRFPDDTIRFVFTTHYPSADSGIVPWMVSPPYREGAILVLGMKRYRQLYEIAFTQVRHSHARSRWETLGKDTNFKIMQSIEQDIGLAPRQLVLEDETCLLYTSPSPRDRQKSRMPSSA